jgi:hypothetical protein
VGDPISVLVALHFERIYACGAEQARAGNDFIVPAFEAIPKWGALSP